MMNVLKYLRVLLALLVLMGGGAYAQVIIVPPALPNGVVLSSTTFDFGDVVVNNSVTSPRFVVTVSNPYVLALPSMTIDASEFLNQTFSLESTTCIPNIVLPGGGNCSMTFYAFPIALGGATNTTLAIKINGVRITPNFSFNGVTGMSVSATSVDFGNAVVGTEGEIRTVVVTNTTGYLLAGNNNASLMGYDPRFPILNPGQRCPDIPAFGSCSFLFAFRPDVVGPQNNTNTVRLIIKNGAALLNLTFTGTGTSTPSFIPALSPLASALGIGSQPAVLNLAGGAGPTMTGCLESAVRGILGADATYIGQVSSGAARISQGGKIISFYPINASASLTPIGANLGGTNLLNVGTSCGNFDVAPALYNVAEFGAAVNALGVAANINPHGVITVVAGSTVYVARPEYFATPGTPGAPSLRQGPDGLYRFTDSAGFSQLLRPAFEDTTALASQAPQALATGGGSTTMVQVDGTALLTSVTGATQFLLTPDLTRSTAADAGMALWRQDAPNHFLFRGSAVSAAQGFGSSKTR